MLVLSRRADEKIIIRLPNGESIVVLMVEIRDKKARLGFTAPPDCVIIREELESSWEGRPRR